MARPGQVRSGLAGLGIASCGKPPVTSCNTRLRGVQHSRRNEFDLGEVRLGKAPRGEAGSGMARRGKVRFGLARPGQVKQRLGGVWHGKVWLGEATRGMVRCGIP